jgi:ABC-2 type transport system ATP-binding protein
MATTAHPSTASTAHGTGVVPIELESLTHDYGSRLALDHISFRVNRGEIFGLLGPNGSGKTTLFRILSTLMVPTSGTARILGFDAAREPNRVRERIGIVFQARSCDIKLTVGENLKHQGHLYGLTGSALKKRIHEVLERVALTDRIHDNVEELSGGMQRRVELAKGLIHSPQVLLLDEPTTGLDPGARIDLWQYLRTLRDEENISVLVTTHLMEEAEHCDRLAILNTGKLVALGSPFELKSEIGGDMVTFETTTTQRAAELGRSIRDRFALEPIVLEKSVRFEREEGHRFVTQVVEAFPGLVESISVAKPSLEDVFVQHTGHRFWNETQDEAPKQSKKH